MRPSAILLGAFLGAGALALWGWGREQRARNEHAGNGRMNTFGGWSYTPLTNTAGDMMLQLGIYGGRRADGVQRLYIGDFKVTDYRPVP